MSPLRRSEVRVPMAARLYLEAILPQAVMLPGEDRADPVPWSFAFRSSGCQAILSGGAEGGVHYERKGDRGGRVDWTLWMPTSRTCVAVFERDLPLAVPVGLPWRLGQFRAGLRFLRRFQRLLTGGLELEEHERLLRVRILAAGALAACKILFASDEEFRLPEGPWPGAVVLEVILPEGRSCSLGWMHLKPDGLDTGSGKCPERAAARVQFEGLAVAEAALADRLDRRAAVGLGQIRLSGRTTLVDSLDLVMDAVSSYLPPR